MRASFTKLCARVEPRFIWTIAVRDEAGRKTNSKHAKEQITNI